MRELRVAVLLAVLALVGPEPDVAVPAAAHLLHGFFEPVARLPLVAEGVDAVGQREQA